MSSHFMESQSVSYTVYEKIKIVSKCTSMVDYFLGDLL